MAKAYKGGKMVPVQSLALEKHYCKQSEHHKSYNLLNNLQLHLSSPIYSCTTSLPALLPVLVTGIDRVMDPSAAMVLDESSALPYVKSV